MKNQDTLAHSRMWDAVSGFIHIFAVLQRKLYKDTSQLELLRELLSLQEEMFILLLSMLEGGLMRCVLQCVMHACTYAYTSREHNVQHYRQADAGHADGVCSLH